MTRAVIFDLAGTLTVPLPPMDPAEPWRRYAAAASSDDPAELGERLLAGERHAFLACRDGGLSFTFGRILDHAGVSPLPAAVAAYRACWEPYTRCVADAAAVLTALRGRGLAVGLLSNTLWPVSWHHEYLARDGVLDLFDAMVFSSELAVAKPHPDAFRAVLAGLGGPVPEDCLFVGDRTFEDISGAHGVGMRTVALPDLTVADEHRVLVDVEPTYRISRLAEVPDVVDRWLALPVPRPVP
jgi:FMN hydrolase / 5-amino-6-(5-phospho-D-ribitylamino)uracil phosphatase